MSKKKYNELSSKVVDLVGSKANVISFQHCMTRLRFNVKDKGLVKKEEIDKIEGVVGTQWSNNQLQIIIGQSVGDAYNQICEENGFQKAASIDEKVDTVMKLTATATLASVGISAIPDDTATPIAEKLTDFTEYFLLILCVLYAEKYLLSVVGAGAFKVLIPLACLLFGASLFFAGKKLRPLALKLAALAVALYLVIPLSITVSDMIYGRLPRLHRRHRGHRAGAYRGHRRARRSQGRHESDPGHSVPPVGDGRFFEKQGRQHPQPLCGDAGGADRHLVPDPAAGACLLPVDHQTAARRRPVGPPAPPALRGRPKAGG